MFRKLSAIFFAMLLLFSTMGIIFYYWAQIQGCKIQAREFIEGNKDFQFQNITKFSSNEKGVELLSRNEIRYKGKMYDIIKIKLENGKKVYYAYSDSKEDSIAEGLAGFAENNAADKIPSVKISFEIAKFIQTRYIPISLNLPNREKNPVTHTYAFTYQPPPLKVISPPPKFFAC